MIKLEKILDKNKLKDPACFDPDNIEIVRKKPKACGNVNGDDLHADGNNFADVQGEVVGDLIENIPPIDNVNIEFPLGGPLAGLTQNQQNELNQVVEELNKVTQAKYDGMNERKRQIKRKLADFFELTTGFVVNNTWSVRTFIDYIDSSINQGIGYVSMFIAAVNNMFEGNNEVINEIRAAEIQTNEVQREFDDIYVIQRD